MKIPLIHSKVHMPRLSRTLSDRPRLIQVLNRITQEDIPISLISANAGTGKTTLLVQWAKDLDQPPAWLILDNEDDNPRSFWLYFIFSLQRVFPGFCQDLMDVLNIEELLQWEDILTELQNQLFQLSGNLLLILEDFHHIQSPQVHQQLSRLIRYLPRQCRLILSTREDPPMELGQLRGQGLLAEIRWKDLRFNASEMEQYFNTSCHLNLNPHDLDLLHGKTEGWAVGMQMAALSMGPLDGDQRRAFIRRFDGNDRYILDYLTETLFQGMDQAQLDFLIQAAPIRSITPQLCDFLYARKDSGEILERLYRQNCFVFPQGQGKGEYRIHHLFQEILIFHFKERYGADELFPLYRRISAWYLEKGEILQAMEYAEESQDRSWLAKGLEEICLELFFSSQMHRLNHWISLIPKPVMEKHPLLINALAGSKMFRASQRGFTPSDLEDLEEMLAWSSQCRNELIKKGGISPRLAQSGYFEEKTRCYLDMFLQKPPEKNIERCERLLEELPDSEIWFRSALHQNLAENYRRLGKVDRAQKEYLETIDCGEICGDGFNVTSSFASLAEIHMESGDLNQAMEWAGEAQSSPYMQGEESIPYGGMLSLRLGDILAHKGDFHGAVGPMERGIRLLSLLHLEFPLRNGKLLLASLYITLGERDKGDLLLEQCYPKGKSFSRLEEVPRELLLFLLRQGKLPEVQEDESVFMGRIESISQSTSISPSLWLRFLFTRNLLSREILSWEELSLRLDKYLQSPSISVLDHADVMKLKVMTLVQLDREEEALSLVIPWFLALWEKGFRWIFLFDVEPWSQFLHRHRNHGVLRNPLNQLFHLAAPTIKPADPQDGLSARENEIMDLILQGLTNQQLCDRLFVSMSTVKTHINRIFGKLQVKNRAELILRYGKL